MGRSLITRLEWSMLYELSEKAKSNKGVRQAFCSCLDMILEDIVKDSVLHSDARSEEKTLKEEDAEKSTQKFINECV
jgi:hypothetical protein